MAFSLSSFSLCLLTKTLDINGVWMLNSLGEVGRDHLYSDRMRFYWGQCAWSLWALAGALWEAVPVYMYRHALPILCQPLDLHFSVVTF